MEVIIHQSKVSLNDSVHLGSDKHPWDDFVAHSMHEQNIGICVISDPVEHVSFDEGLPSFEMALIIVVEHNE